MDKVLGHNILCYNYQYSIFIKKKIINSYENNIWLASWSNDKELSSGAYTIT